MMAYQKVIVYYFSGTGNSRNVASWVSKIANEKGIECQLVNIALTTQFPIGPPEANSLVIFVSPVHGFNYPPVMVSFLAHFPKGSNDVILMNTRAGMLIGKWITPGLTGIAFYLAALFLKLKGYSIHGMLPVDLPSNWISVHPGLNQKTVLYLHLKMKIKVSKYAVKVLKGQKSYPALWEILQDIAISPVALGYYFLARFILAKTYYASSACDNCGLCIRNCPVKAIEMVSERPFWNLTCESCMRCMGSCPKKAIETAHGFVFLVTLIFQWGLVGTVNHFFPNLIATINPFLYEWILQFVLFLGFLMICYRTMHFLKKYNWFNKLMVYTSLTYYKFWGRRYKAIKGF